MCDRHRGEERERREREERFLVKESNRLSDSFTVTPHIRLALRPTDGHAFYMQTRSALAAVPSTRHS